MRTALVTLCWAALATAAWLAAGALAVFATLETARDRVTGEVPAWAVRVAAVSPAVLTAGSLLVPLAVAVLGARGRLPGARRGVDA